MSSRDFPGLRQTVTVADSPVLVLSLPILPYFKRFSKNITQKKEFLQIQIPVRILLHNFPHSEFPFKSCI